MTILYSIMYSMASTSFIFDFRKHISYIATVNYIATGNIERLPYAIIRNHILNQQAIDHPLA